MPRKYTPEERVAAFWAKADRSGGPDACWPWAGLIDRYGYGRYSQHKVRGKALAHRVAWELTHGPIPTDDDGKPLCVLHDCPDGDNPACCNPAHLWLGTNADNVADRGAKGRTVRGEQAGLRKLTAATVSEIRQRYAIGGVYQRDLAHEYGVSRSLVQQITARAIWRHIE